MNWDCMLNAIDLDVDLKYISKQFTSPKFLPKWNLFGAQKSPYGYRIAYEINLFHYSDVIMDVMASQITSLNIVYSTVYSGADIRKHQIPASLAFVRGIHRSPMNSPNKWPVTRKMFPFDDVIIFVDTTPLCTQTHSCLLRFCIGYQLGKMNSFPSRCLIIL